MPHYSPYGLSVTIEDDGLLNSTLKERMLKNDWERAEVEALEGLNPHSSVLELGACVGIISCMVNKMLSDGSQHVAVEANPNLMDQLASVRDENGCLFKMDNCTIGDTVGNRAFYVHNSHIMGSSAHLRHSSQATQVKQTTIKALEAKHSISFDVLIMDIEHGEYELFDKCLLPNDYFLKFHTIICEFHGSKDHDKEISDVLIGGGYTATQFQSRVSRFDREI